MAGTGDHLIAERLTLFHPVLRGTARANLRLAPPAPIKARQGHGSPVQLRLRRYRPGKGRAKGQLTGTRQISHVRRGHAFCQPGTRLGTRRINRPQRPQPREQQEQHQHQGDRLQQHHPGRAHGPRRIITSRRLLQTDQSSNQNQQRETLEYRQRNSLIEQEGRGDDKETQVDDHQRITWFAHLKQFEHEQ